MWLFLFLAALCFSVRMLEDENPIWRNIFNGACVGFIGLAAFALMQTEGMV